MAHVLVTNDDGVIAEGLTTLRARLLELGLRVSVVAPDGNRSGMARAISFDRPVAVVAAGGTDRDPLFACTGSPVDCVRVGLLSGLVAPVDLVVSGINHGLNVGDDITYSGTVGAALEAAILDVPAIAVSQQADDGSFRFNDSGLKISFRLAAAGGPAGAGGREPPPPARTVLNVNLPRRGGTPRVVLTRPGRRYFTPDVVQGRRRHADGQAFYPYGLAVRSGAALRRQRGHRLRGAAGGCISVSLLAGGAADETSAARRSWFADDLRPLGQRSRDERRASPPCPRRRRRRRHRRHVGRLPPRREGWTDVLLLEQNALGAGTTWHAAGAVGRLRVTGSLARMNDRSARLYARIEAETGRAGRLQAGRRARAGAAAGADGAAAPERLDGRALRRRRADHLAGDEAAELWPLAQLDDVIGAAWLPDDGRAEPGQLPRADRARARGARARPIREGVRVLEVLHDGRRVTRRAHRSRRRDGRGRRARVRHVDAPARQRGCGVSVPLHPVEHHYLLSNPTGRRPRRRAGDARPRRLDLLPRRAGRDPDRRVPGGRASRGWSTEVPDDFAFSLLEPDWEHFAPPLAEGYARLPILARDRVREVRQRPGELHAGRQPAHGRDAGAGSGCTCWRGSTRPASRSAAARARRSPSGSSAASSRSTCGRSTSAGSARGRQPRVPARPHRRDARHALPAGGAEPRVRARPRPAPVAAARPARRRTAPGSARRWASERPNWFAGPGQRPAVEYGFGRQNWFENHRREHAATREAVAVFDQSSFGKFAGRRPRRLALLQRLCANDVDVAIGRVVYTAMLNARGTFESDLTVIRIAPRTVPR